MKFMTLVAAAALTLALPMTAKAATLGLETLAEPVAFGSGSSLARPILGFSFLASGAEATFPAAAIDLSIVATAGADFLGGALNIGSTSDGLFLGGTISDVGSVFDADGEDRIEFLIDITGGSAAGSFGASVLAIFAGEFGADDGALVAGFGPVSTSISVAPVAPPAVIPLPAALPMLLSGLGLAALMRRRRRG